MKKSLKNRVENLSYGSISRRMAFFKGNYVAQDETAFRRIAFAQASGRSHLLSRKDHLIEVNIRVYETLMCIPELKNFRSWKVGLTEAFTEVFKNMVFVPLTNGKDFIYVFFSANQDEYFILNNEKIIWRLTAGEDSRFAKKKINAAPMPKAKAKTRKRKTQKTRKRKTQKTKTLFSATTEISYNYVIV